MAGNLFRSTLVQVHYAMDVDSGVSAGEDWTAQDDSLFATPTTTTTQAAAGVDTVRRFGGRRATARQSSGTAVRSSPLDAVRPSQSQSQMQMQMQSQTSGPALAGPAPSSREARAREREELNKGVLMFRQPMSVATVVVRGAEFVIHADLLCQHSDYFARALRGSFAEAQTQRIELDGDDISAEDFGLWVDLLYRAHFHQRVVTAGGSSIAGGATTAAALGLTTPADRAGGCPAPLAADAALAAPASFLLRKEETGGTLSTKQILTLWQLSDRFLHRPLAALAEESLHHRLGLYSPDQWRKLYRSRPASDIRARVGRLQDAYRQCTEHGLPFADQVVAACAACPPQVYADCVDLLDPDFMALVSRRMILAHADTSLVSKDQRETMTDKREGR